MRILNLYAGIGGNRKLWGREHRITAVEKNPEIAKIYKELFPNDEVIIADAHQYLLENFRFYDFIWSSPPCQSHSHMKRLLLQSERYKKKSYEYFDVKLWQEIILLKHFAPENQKWVIENVRSYYKPLIPPSAEIGRHFFWSNFYIRNYNYNLAKEKVIENIKSTDEHFGFSLAGYNIRNKRQILRNLVNPEIANYLLNTAAGIREPIQEGLFKEISK